MTDHRRPLSAYRSLRVRGLAGTDGDGGDMRGSDDAGERADADDAVTDRWPVADADHVDALDRPDRLDRADRVDPVDHADRTDRTDRTDRAGSSDWLLAPAGDESGRLEVATDAVTEAIPHGRTAQRRARRRRTLWWGIAGVLLVALVGGAFVVQVADGASTREIGEELQTKDVVASARAFGSAAEDDPNGRGIQPGYYEIRQQMSAAGAVTALLDPASRLGRADVRSGTQLDDTAGPAGSTVPGVLSLIAKATCLPDASGAERCASVDDLRRTMATTDPGALGVPTWALDGVRRADPARRLEGLVAPGTYDIAPGATARDALSAVLRVSGNRLEATGLVGEAERQRISPYQVLTVASLAEKEGVADDFGKVSRVIYNRLALPMRLQFDSTINYPLDKQRLLTAPGDRARPGPYNSYLNLGLPPTPIASVSSVALQAAMDPTPGPWVYFVKCQAQGESCFAVTQPEHDANRRLAQQRGVY